MMTSNVAVLACLLAVLGLQICTAATIEKENFVRKCGNEMDPIPIDIGNCGGLFMPTAVYVEPCALAPRGPCAVNKGQNVSIYINFNSTVDADAPYTYVYGLIRSIPVPYSVGDYANVCSHLMNYDSCPIKAGQVYSYNIQVPVLEEYPSLTLAVEVKIADKKGSSDYLTCFAFALQIN
ncbi:NPC intracellular cholesterol transporter 2-like [Convolutriloba macropyga]|uniref:NPC intracellular cholesterol transporter 2-like n=1 Tax=Convolutriloba macropyga TaxID=536237 RepID=UPI003F51CAA5